MTKKEYINMLDVWAALQVALACFTLPESNFPKGKDYALKYQVEKAYIVIDKMVANGKGFYYNP